LLDGLQHGLTVLSLAIAHDVHSGHMTCLPDAISQLVNLILLCGSELHGREPHRDALEGRVINHRIRQGGLADNGSREDVATVTVC